MVDCKLSSSFFWCVMADGCQLSVVSGRLLRNEERTRGSLLYGVKVTGDCNKFEGKRTSVLRTSGMSVVQSSLEDEIWVLFYCSLERVR